jgi:hypothetical protein
MRKIKFQRAEILQRELSEVSSKVVNAAAMPVEFPILTLMNSLPGVTSHAQQEHLHPEPPGQQHPPLQAPAS